MGRFLALLLLLAGMGASGQTSYPFLHLNISNGLPHDRVTAISSDDEGFVWFGSQVGLSRFDGNNFKSFRKTGGSNSLPDDNIIRILPGPNKKLWIETRSGFCIYNSSTGSFSHNIREALQQLHIPDQNISNIVRKNATVFYLQTDAGLYAYDAHRAQSTLLKKTSNANKITSYAPVPNGLWVVYQNGDIEKLQENGKIITTIARLKELHPGTSNYTLMADREGTLWIYTSLDVNGVYKYQPAKDLLEHFTKENGTLNTNLITGIQEDRAGKIWICTDHGGINLYDKATGKVQYILNHPEDNKSLSQNSITASYVSADGIIWLGTYKHGVNYYNPAMVNFPLYRHMEGTASLSFDDVNRFAEDEHGNIWIGTNGGGLIYYNRKDGSFKQYLHSTANSNSLSSNVIVSLCIDHHKKLWIGTYFGGLDCYDGKQFVHYRHSDKNPASIADDKIWEVYEDSYNNLWIGTMEHGMDRYNAADNSFSHYPLTDNANDVNKVTAITEDNLHQLWIGTDNGIHVLPLSAGMKPTPLSAATLISQYNIHTLMKKTDGTIWAGGKDGLAVFSTGGKLIRNLGAADELPDKDIFGILEEKNGAIWVSSLNGLARLTLPATGAAAGLQVRRFDETDGLQGREFNEDASLKLHTGELVYGGANGFNLFNPQAVKDIDNAPKTVITGIQLFNKEMETGDSLNGRVFLKNPIEQTRELTLKHNENVFSISFAALHFGSNGKTRFLYQLEGFDKQWLLSDFKQTKSTYTNIDPGDYAFKVKAVGSDGNPGKTVASLKIKILPPFWKTPVAYLCYIIVFVAILVLIRRTELKKERRRYQQLLEKQEELKVRELDLLKIKFFTNISHEFRTPISLILVLLDKMCRSAADNSQLRQYKMVQRNALRLLHLVNQLLDFRKMETQELKLNAERGEVISFIKDTVQSFSDIAERKNIAFAFTTALPGLEMNFDRDKLERILFNLLSNAFKFTPDKGKITVTALTSKEGNQLVIKVQDTGIGIPADKKEKIFENFYQHDTPASILNQGSGIGLTITKEFVRLHNGRIMLDTEEGEGACFTIMLPVDYVQPAPAADAALADFATSIPFTEQQETENVHQIISEQEAPEAAEKKQVRTGQKPLVLLVEDNEDFRFYLKDNLEEHFEIADAPNGVEGWKKALQLQPALVVSDVNMPLMNGLELCGKIKKDARTAQIPVILLTALSAEEQKIEGLTTGANDYITKPFNFEILLTRIRNILDQQVKMKKVYQKKVAVKTTETVTESADEGMIRQALEMVEKNIANPDFSVEELSRLLFISRVGLYKKLLSVTGKTPIEFIRHVRLERAAQLLKASGKTVAEVAYEVGFNNPKYFTRYFKEEYGCNPSAYAGRKEEPEAEDAVTAGQEKE